MVKYFRYYNFNEVWHVTFVLITYSLPTYDIINRMYQHFEPLKQ